MIIRKQDQFWTQEEKNRLQEIRAEQAQTMSRLALERNEQGKPNLPLLAKWGELEEQAEAIAGKVEQRYISARGKDGLLKDAAEIVDAIEKKDYLERIAEQLRHIATLEALSAQDDARARANLDELRKYAVENYENCCMFILRFLRVQLNAFAEDPDGTQKVKALIEARAALWYVKTQPAFLAMVHGRATDAIARMAHETGIEDPVTHARTITVNDVKLVLKAAQDMGVSAHKLLSAAMVVFTAQNCTDRKKRELRSAGVEISLAQYALLSGYDVIVHDPDNPREVKRAENALKDARKQTRKDLKALYDFSMSWQETVRGKPKNFENMRLIYDVGISNGYIRIFFTPPFAEYLVQLPLTQYALALLGVDERNPHAYALGLAITEHYSMDSNQEQGTADRLKVQTLLKYTNIKPIEEVRKARKSWIERIKEPFEKALEELHSCGLLEEWEYTGTNGIPLTEAENAALFDSYEEWAKTLVRFTLNDTPDQAARLAARAEEKEKRSQRNRKPRKKKQTSGGQ